MKINGIFVDKRYRCFALYNQEREKFEIRIMLRINLNIIKQSNFF